MAMALPITSLYTGLFMLLLLVLAVGVVVLRQRTRTSLGDGGHKALRQAIRSYGNAVEYVPIMLLGLALLELANVNPALLHLYGSLFLLGRFAHAFGMQQRREVNKARLVGIVITWALMLILGIHLVIESLVL